MMDWTDNMCLERCVSRLSDGEDLHGRNPEEHLCRRRTLGTCGVGGRQGLAENTEEIQLST